MNEEIIVVSGLPRSGTSLLMQMLAAGGVPVLSDGARRADEDNPRGYHEFERVKALPRGDTAWLPEARGKAVKVITALLPWLPPTERYRVLLVERAIPELLASQRAMLARRGEPLPDAAGEAALAAHFAAHLAETRAWLAAQPHMATLAVAHRDLLRDPAPPVATLNAFLGGHLDEAAMRAVVDPRLYRNRER